MTHAIREGFRALGRSWGLAVLLWAVNVGLAALLAAPLAATLERDLRHRDAAANMMYGFDYGWWSPWSDAHTGWKGSFSPEIFGVGFAFRNLELLSKGVLPVGLFRAPTTPEPEEGRNGESVRPDHLDDVILSLGALYLVAQTFLAGGLLGVFRGPQGSWTVRGLLHGSGFYFGRFLRVAALALIGLWMVFRLNAPLAPWADQRARESVSETGALAWSFGRHLLLLLAILFVHMVSSYAKVIVAVEERSSALLALLSSLGFCLRNLHRAAGQYLALVAMGVALIVAWGALDSRWETTGYRTQLVALLLAQAFVLCRVGLRLSLLAGQVALYRRYAA